MVIDPAILIPAASFAVLAMVLFIRLMTGPRNKKLTDTTIRNFLRLEETSVPIIEIIISLDNRFSLVRLDNQDPIRLIRAFGDTLVMQSLSPNDISEKKGKLSIRRQDISHAGVLTEFAADDFSKDWKRRPAIDSMAKAI